MCGCIAGTLAAGTITDNSSLKEFISGYIRLVEDGTSAQSSFLTSLINAFKYHLTAVFLGFSVLGIFFIPALSAVRGFFLSFSIAAVIRLFGSGGIVLALSIFGFGTLLTIPCYFILAVQAFSMSFILLRMTLGSGGRVGLFQDKRRFLFNLIICVALLILSAIIETYLTSHLIRFAAANI